MAFGGRAGRGAQGCGGRGRGSKAEADRAAAILTAAAFGAVPVDLEKSNQAGNAVDTLIFDLKMAQPVTIDRDLTEIKGERWVRRPSTLAKAEGKRKFTETEWADEYDQPEDWAVCARRSRAPTTAPPTHSPRPGGQSCCSGPRHHPVVHPSRVAGQLSTGPAYAGASSAGGGGCADGTLPRASCAPQVDGRGAHRHPRAVGARQNTWPSTPTPIADELFARGGARAARSGRCCGARAHAAAVAVREGRVGPEAVEPGREPLHAPAACQALAACSAATGGGDVWVSRPVVNE